MSQIIDLNGEWKFIFDTHNEGLDNRWYAAIPQDLKTVNVPHIWEEEFPKTKGSIGFYYKDFEIEEGENTKRMFLKFDKVAIATSVWVNGKHVGDNFGGYHPFEIEISSAVKAGEVNTIAMRVCVVDSYDRISNFKAPVQPIGLSWYRQRFSGICGDVKLVMGQKACIRSVHVIPDHDTERITIDLKFNNPRNYNAKMKILVTDPDGQLGMITKETKLDREDANLLVTLNFKEWTLWNIDSPKLYKLEIYLEKSYPVECNFAFRKFDCLKGGDFYLNDRIITIRGLTYNQEDPKNALVTRDLKKTRKELTSIKKLGFNTIRTAGCPISKEALDICDEIGLLVFQDMPIYDQKSDKTGLEHAKQAIENIVKYSNNHPSAVAWVLGSENSTLMLENGNKLFKTLDQFDSTRPAFTNINSTFVSHNMESKHDTGKILGVTTKSKVEQYSSHRLNLKTNSSANFNDFLTKYFDKKYSDIEIPDISFGDADFQESYPKIVSKSKGKSLITLSNNSLLPPNEVNTKLAYYKAIKAAVETDKTKPWKNIAEFIEEANNVSMYSKQEQLDAILSNESVSAFFIDNWVDFNDNLTGFLNINRASKGFEDYAKNIAEGTRILIHSLEGSVTADNDFCLDLSLLNEVRMPNASIEAKIVTKAGKKAGEVVKEHYANTSESKQYLGKIKLKAPKKVGEYSIVIDLFNDKKKLVSSLSRNILVLDADDLDDTLQVCFLDQADDSAMAKKMISGKENIIISSSPSSWNESTISNLMAAAKNGKSVVLTDLEFEDIDFLNSCDNFDFELSGNYSTGINGAAWHFVQNKKLFKFYNKNILDNTCAALTASISLNELEGAEIHLASITLENNKIVQGVDLQIIKFGKGKLVFCQSPILDTVETSASANKLFCNLMRAI